MGKDLAAATNFRAQLETLFAKALAAAFPALEGEEPLMAACNQPKNGDYQCNNAMSLFGKLKGKPGAPKAPRDVATALLAALPANDMISETSLAGPGFINLRLARPFVAANISAIITQGTRRLAPDLASKKRFDEDEAFKTRARESVTALQSGEPSARAAWQRICAASRKEFQAIYTRLGVTLQRVLDGVGSPSVPTASSGRQVLPTAEQARSAKGLSATWSAAAPGSAG
ncbi:putative arginine--tRNA ligase, cytoplasmic [Haematococcus lacustris]|uniref:arginine--tRNA ligase n=1 Tax=Haematococcus lacustris TaxID=44745 RepID=A0A699YST7_HAELA|nr:putative arginine--tRNA ligase, cytoplasmic [Haematococcus lacustris]